MDSFPDVDRVRYLSSRAPEMVEKWEEETPTGTRLPRKLGKRGAKRSKRDD